MIFSWREGRDGVKDCIYQHPCSTINDDRTSVTNVIATTRLKYLKTVQNNLYGVDAYILI